MIDFNARTEGLDGQLAGELLRDTRKKARSTLSKAATPFARTARDSLSSRAAPSAPGSPPARVEGALRSSIGKDRPRRRGDEFFVTVGVGAGKAALRRVNEWKSKGINVFEYALLHERGGIGAGGRRYPPRPFMRTAEIFVEPEVEAILIAGLS